MQYVVLILALFVIAVPVSAQVSIDFPTSFAGLSSQDLKTTIENIIRIIVGFIGYIAIIIIFTGGMKWMLSGGNEDKIAEAKNLIATGVVGIIIVLSSYSIANFLISSLQQAV